MEKFNELLSTGPKVLNIGLKSFYESCETQGIPVVHIRWEPPAQGKPKLLSLLDELL
ncbi:MAG: fdrA domain protein [Promethearchaeota archaeon]